ncbi:ABC transporter ATP-binding protein [Bacillus sp. 1P10SD]|uniref:ABC transporter ATP-binding protein n=1 Tax=Bacillus sp. 1P10SD TaxID=3132265 RepID=UPI0039A6F0B1
MLEVKDLRKQFGGITAINEISFTLPENGILGVIGPNGAGKTTLFNLLTGIYKPDSGKILFENKDISSLNSTSIARMGIARTYQLIRLFKSLSVLENVMLGAQLANESKIPQMMFQTKAHKENERKIKENAIEILKGVGLYEHRDRLSGALSYGQQRRLEIARALAMKPKILLLDEPAAGMNGKEIEDLREFLMNLSKTDNVRIIIIEHNVRMIMKISSRVIVLNFGEKIAEGTPIEIQRNQQVIEAYIGKEKKNA